MLPLSMEYPCQDSLWLETLAHIQCISTNVLVFEGTRENVESALPLPQLSED
jgi:hypothetical protein